MLKMCVSDINIYLLICVVKLLATLVLVSTIIYRCLRQRTIRGNKGCLVGRFRCCHLSTEPQVPSNGPEKLNSQPRGLDVTQVAS